jgi:hypothetical protein
MLLKLKPPTFEQQKNYLDIAMIKFITKLSPNYKKPTIINQLHLQMK